MSPFWRVSHFEWITKEVLMVTENPLLERDGEMLWSKQHQPLIHKNLDDYSVKGIMNLNDESSTSL